ncbi:acyltransferase domain-containing protein [Streptomyces sp. NPDC001339]|uniref:acyltransferase domain-containing protein n=1 Tax=Streptomyces sp. NPDC001339 TaxID=3364563 RepID=UPI0036B24C98
MFPDVMPLVLSADSPAALRARAHRLRQHLDGVTDTQLPPLAHALAAGDRALRHRAVLLAGGADDARRRLADLAAGRTPYATAPGGTDPVRTGAVRHTQRPVLVFPGQGPQWDGMALDLMEHSEVFRTEMHRCDRELAHFADWSVTDVLRRAPGAPALDGADVVQPVLFAVMVSLAALWEHYGVTPAAVVGHSLGEVAAATAAGALGRADGMRISALWSAAQATLAGRGEMLSVPLPLDEVERRLRGRDGLGVAGVNGPGWAVVSGDSAPALDLLADLRAEGVPARHVPVGLAAHSRHIEELRERLLTDLAPVRPGTARVPFHSTVVREGADGASGAAALHRPGVDTTGLDAAYWYRNLRTPVRFDLATRALVERGARVFVEISPHPVLTVGLQDTVEQAGADATVLASLRRGENGPRHFLTALADAYVRGVGIDWRAAFDGVPAGQLPDTAATAEVVTVRARAAGEAAAAPGLEPAAHPLLATVAELAGPAPHIAPDEAAGPGDGTSAARLFTGRIDPGDHPWLAGHTALERAVLPAAALVDLALHAGAELGCTGLAAFTQHLPVVLDETRPLLLQLHVSAADPTGARRFTVHCRPETALPARGEDWTRHATGQLAGQPAGHSAGPGLPETWPPAGIAPLDPAAARRRLAALGLGHGPAHTGLTAAWSHGDDILAEVRLPHQAGPAEPFALHPALLDAALHTVALFPAADGETTGWLPAEWYGVTLHATGSHALRLRITPAGPDSVALTAADETGRTVLTADRIAMEPLPAAYLRDPASVAARAPGTVHGPGTASDGVPDSALAARLAGMEPPQRLAELLDLVCEHTAEVLGAAAPDTVPADRPFTALGFDSLGALALRNRLGDATGLKLRTTLIFDFPTPAALAAHLRDRIAPQDTPFGGVLRELDELEKALTAALTVHTGPDGAPGTGTGAAPGGEDGHKRVRARLQDLLFTLESATGGTTAALPVTADDSLDTVTDDELFELLDEEFDGP